MQRTTQLLPLLLVLAACASPTAGPGPAQTDNIGHEAVDARSLAARHWRLADATEAGGQRIDALFPDAAKPLRFEFADGRIAISGGCNRLSAAYTLEGGRLSVGPVAQTKMFCGGGALMAADDAIVAQLARPHSVSMDGNRLVLASADGERLVFDGEAIPATP